MIRPEVITLILRKVSSLRDPSKICDTPITCAASRRKLTRARQALEIEFGAKNRKLHSNLQRYTSVQTWLTQMRPVLHRRKDRLYQSTLTNQ